MGSALSGQSDHFLSYFPKMVALLFPFGIIFYAKIVDIAPIGDFIDFSNESYRILIIINIIGYILIGALFGYIKGRISDKPLKYKSKIFF